ncbi:peptidoglycan-binding domain-containing protein [Streptomyces sp. NPDC054863]
MDNNPSTSEQATAGRGTMVRRRRLLVGLIAGAVTLSSAGLVASFAVKSPAEAAAQAKPPPPDVLTAPVTRQVLEQKIVIRGTVVSSQSVDVAPIGGPETKPVITKVPLKAGEQINAGHALLEVAGRPVLALQGELPVYRDLKPGSTGQDVRQLQQALRRLDLYTTSVTGTFDSATKAAVKDLYTKRGYDPLSALPDGDVQVTVAQDNVTAGQQRLQDAKEAQTATPDRGDNGEAARRQTSRAAHSLEELKKKLAAAQALAGPMVPASEIVYLSSFPARVTTVTGKVGDSVSGKVMTVAAGKLGATGTLGRSDKDLVRVGQRVEILSEPTGQKSTGTIASVSDTADSAPQQQGTTGTPNGADSTTPSGHAVIVTPDHPLDPKLAGQQVRLTVTAGSSNGRVLVVPASAVSATSDGRTVVTVYTQGRRRQSEVATGAVGGGGVEIRPVTAGAVKEGDHVIVGIKDLAR